MYCFKMVMPNFNKENRTWLSYLEMPKSSISAFEFCKLGAYCSWFITFQFGLYAFMSGEDIIGLSLILIFGLIFVYFGYLIYRGNRPLSILICVISLGLGSFELFILGNFSVTKIIFPILSVYGVIGTFKFHEFKKKENRS